MKTTSFVSAALTALVLSTSAVMAADPALYADDVLVQTVTAQLEAQGFIVVDVERTLLGRYKIEALSADGAQREMVISANSGEVLRDQIDQVSVDGYEDGSDENEIENADDNEVDGHSEDNTDNGSDDDGADDNGSDDDNGADEADDESDDV